MEFPPCCRLPPTKMSLRPIALLASPAIAVAIGLTVFAFRGSRLESNTPEFSRPTETAVFSGGCFWGLQAALDKLPGVVRTRAGYTGGTTSHPTYEQVVAGGTGHAEAVEVVFDPGRLAFSDLVAFLKSLK